MKSISLVLVFLLTGCLGDKIPWDIAKVKQSEGAVCVYAPGIDEGFIYERVKIQKAGESKEFIADVTGRKYAKNKCLPMMGYKFITNNEYNVSFSVVDANSGKRKVYAVRFIDKYSSVN
ncbi:putative T6SS immunity periplasmic lipoprotein [Rouxiella sp. Mn2063]|uniref:putative T6SS immunity periplasmic lipoprotein n=1 Tax=Rouxiella sp. Mn2063 TaxID=3395262 RepID=UPI003BD5FB85